MGVTRNKYVLGIDEAGRGPVIGGMFIAGVVLNERISKKLRSLGVKDSKKLTPSKRAALFPKIIALAKAIYVIMCSPETIDSRNLNILTLESILRMIEHLGRRIELKKIYIDALSGKRASYLLRSRIPPIIKLIYEPKADVKYVPVSAASIVAKYLRDEHIRILKQKYGDFGSGYPSDPKTIKWLANMIKVSNSLPNIVRKSWRTLERFGYKPAKIKGADNLLSWIKRPYSDSLSHEKKLE